MIIIYRTIQACKAGKENKAAAEYEHICTDIVRYLFDGEFTQLINISTI